MDFESSSGEIEVGINPMLSGDRYSYLLATYIYKVTKSLAAGTSTSTPDELAINNPVGSSEESSITINWYAKDYEPRLETSPLQVTLIDKSVAWSEQNNNFHVKSGRDGRFKLKCQYLSKYRI